MIAVLLKARDVEAQREARRNDCDARNISAIDIAKVVSACAYHGDVERGMQWWAGTRVILERMCPIAVRIAEAPNSPDPHFVNEDKLLYDVRIACIDASKAKGADLLLKIHQQQPMRRGWLRVELFEMACGVVSRVSEPTALN
mmetsp:Transcript_24456/g.56917  ORF Transcript_24456/g.56917 Transcript_24456/m.56917 type:complete len:143 (-) Transcript_24456:28-456(-)|eukprot:CAMPEP_0119372534 /NCGR_PEP_ID=MMETSP1334-20130426/19908_1 /TAXON_ID=127549 /ORGANISM="Calcidiscus leptoporus, Strain RCC1130" /LENGTH=142 /DNA_ID=CAMNT_0007390045 /DNA_START=238 /DNA_END=666 /DNA_ORIENTATION=-